MDFFFGGGGRAWGACAQDTILEYKNALMKDIKNNHKSIGKSTPAYGFQKSQEKNT
jgi:hypothetical protein